jgi:hypothetical protein
MHPHQHRGYIDDSDPSTQPPIIIGGGDPVCFQLMPRTVAASLIRDSTWRKLSFVVKITPSFHDNPASAIFLQLESVT